MHKYTKEELKELLILKTKSLKHQVTFSDMVKDPTMPNPNLYAYYYGSFTDAAREIYHSLEGRKNLARRGVSEKESTSKELSALSNPSLTVRQEEIINFIVDYFIKNNGALPPYRHIEKQLGVKSEEIDKLRVTEARIRQLAIEKTGREFAPAAVRRIKNGMITKKQKKGGTKMAITRTEKNIREEYIEILKKECEKLGHVPTQSEVRLNKKMPSWSTLIRYIGPCKEWDKITGYPFKKKGAKLSPSNVATAKPIATKPQGEDTSLETESKIPITLIVPKGVHGQVTITLNI